MVDAVRGMRAVFNSKKPRMVPLGEMTAAVAVQVTAARGVDVGSWVRAKAGLYKGDLAQVVDLDASGARATLRLVPRLDLAALSARRPEDARANFGRAPRVRPAAKAFSPDEVCETGKRGRGGCEGRGLSVVLWVYHGPGCAVA